jgi:hypothetical protein
MLGHLSMCGRSHDHDLTDAGLLTGVEHQVDHGPARQLMENLRLPGPHASPEAGG